MDMKKAPAGKIIIAETKELFNSTNLLESSWFTYKN